MVGKHKVYCVCARPSERLGIFFTILNALKLSFEELTSGKYKKCNGEVSGKAWGD